MQEEQVRYCLVHIDEDGKHVLALICALMVLVGTGLLFYRVFVG